MVQLMLDKDTTSSLALVAVIDGSIILYHNL